MYDHEDQNYDRGREVEQERPARKGPSACGGGGGREGWREGESDGEERREGKVREPEFALGMTEEEGSDLGEKVRADTDNGYGMRRG